MCEEDYVEMTDFVNFSLFFEFFEIKMKFFKSLLLLNLFSLLMLFTAMISLMTLQTSFFSSLISFALASLFFLINWIILLNSLSFPSFYVSFLSSLDFCLITSEFESNPQSSFFALIHFSLQIILMTSVSKSLKLFIIFMMNALSVL